MSIACEEPGRRLTLGLAAALIAAVSVPVQAASRDTERYDHPRYVIDRGRKIVIPPGRRRVYGNVVILRPYGHYGHWYSGYGHYRIDGDAYRWLAFTAITFALLNALNESQQRALEEDQIRATTAPIGERIVWSNDDANGSVTAVREGDEHQRPLLPGIPAAGHRGRTDAGSVRHGMPARRRFLGGYLHRRQTMMTGVR